MAALVLDADIVEPMKEVQQLLQDGLFKNMKASVEYAAQVVKDTNSTKLAKIADEIVAMTQNMITVTDSIAEILEDYARDMEKVREEFSL